MTKIMDMSKLIDAAKKMGINEEELRALLPLMLEVQDEKTKSDLKTIKKAKGGDIAEQMEMFQDGGLKDEGGTKDPVSGNDVPPGATQEEVRDDIPAQLSEGEFVFPADVVRYIGLEKLMKLRQDAKMGLKVMEEMGQMGNADEATIPDDIPFSLIDIDMAEDDEEVEERAQGGVIRAANGFAGTTTTTNPVQKRQPNVAGTQTGIKQPYVAPTIPSATAAPVGGFTYKSPVDSTKRATYTGLFGGDELGLGPDEYRTFVNDAGVEIQIPFKNGELFTGFTIPEGFSQKTEDTTAKPKTARVQTSRVQSVSSDDDRPDKTQGAVDLTGAPLSYKSLFGMDKLDTALKGIAVSQFNLFDPKAAITRGVTNQVDINSVNLSMQKDLLTNYKKTSGLDVNFNLVELPTVQRDQLADGMNQLSNSVKNVLTDFEGKAISINELVTKANDYGININRQDLNEKGTNILSKKQVNELAKNVVKADFERKKEKEDIRQQVVRTGEAISDQVQKDKGFDFGAGISDAQIDDTSDRSGSQESYESEATGSQDFSQDAFDDPLMKQGGLAKKKVKPKKMKRGGLASKK